MNEDRMADELEALKTENVELKIAAVRKDVANLKNDLHIHLDRILDQTSKTNGSVARALERIYKLERQETKVQLDKLNKEFSEYKEQTKFWHTLSQNKWIAGLIVFSMYAFTIQEIRDALFTLLKLK